MPARLLSLVVLVGATTLLTGCATTRTPAQRIADDPALFESWPPAVQQQVEAGEVAVGFTPDQVQMALGEPDDTASRTTAEGQTEVWIYRERGPRLGFGLGVSGGSGGSGVGLGVGTSSGGTREPRLRVVFSEGVVSAVERSEPRGD